MENFEVLRLYIGTNRGLGLPKTSAFNVAIFTVILSLHSDVSIPGGRDTFPGVQFTNIAWLRHQMETFSALLALCAEFPTQMSASDAELWCFLWSVPE